MKNKEQFVTNIQSRLVLYILYAVVAVFLWSYIIILVTNDKPKEIVSVWIMAYSCDTETLTEELESVKADYLKHVRVYSESQDGTYTYVKYAGIGADCDILILPESFIEQSQAPSSFAALDENLMESLFGSDLEYYSYNSVIYGIKIFDKDSSSDGCIGYTEEGTEAENYYLFINKDSLHMSEINGSSMDGGIDIVKELLANES